MLVLSAQINVKSVAALDGTTELTSSTPLESKAVTGDGIVALTLGPGQPFGVFDPGLFVGGQQTDYFLQSLQVSSTAGTAGGTVRLVGTAPPSALVQLAEMIVRHLAENALKWTAWTPNGETEATRR